MVGIVETAAAEIGYREGPNNDTKYGAWYGMNNNPWCMMFVSWCAHKAGIGTDIIPKLAYVPYAVDFFRAQGRYRDKGYVPHPGDIVFFGSSSHVGIVEKIAGDMLYSIEGNTSASGNTVNGDGVYRRSRRLSDSWIMGYASPMYKEDDVEIKDILILNTDTGATLKAKGFYSSGTNYIRLRDAQLLAPVVIDWDREKGMPTVRANYVQQE